MKNTRMKAARVLAGLTQSELAEKIGLNVQSIYRIEMGIFDPSLKTCKKICRALNVTLDQIFEDEEFIKKEL